MKLKAQVEELTRANQELSSAESRLQQENSDLERQLKDTEDIFGSALKLKIQLQQ